MQKNKHVFVLFFFVSFNFLKAQEIKIDSVISPAILFNNRFENAVVKNVPKNLHFKSTQNFLFLYFHSDYPIEDYEYQMMGLETYFISTKNNFAYYPNIPSGNYWFTVRDKRKPKLNKKLHITVEGLIWQKWWFSPLVFLFICGVLGLIFYFFYLIRLRQQLRLQAVRHELEIKALRAQMNPHFIFNSMNTIDAYILRKRFIEASDCLQKFSKLIRQILENSENQTISVSQELETLKLYIELEQERFSYSFSYQFEIQPELLEKDYQIPPLLIQPFVENAILHGIRHLTERKGEISLNLSISKSLLLCVITDNGIGRKASSEINQQRQESHKSMGVDITMERISGYQALYGDKMETNISDLTEGTRVEIKLPLILV